MKYLELHNKPLAIPSLISYRYKGKFGFIMIGATDNEDALSEAQRSSSVNPVKENLEIWNGQKYINAYPEKQ